MEVDQIQSLKGKGKGAKNDKPHCKTCGKAHAGKCWYQEGGKGKGKGNKGKGRGDPPKKGDHKGGKEACQICGKKNHTADKCFQRYKDGKGSRVQAASATPETGGTASASGAGAVMALSRAEVDTSPETELRATTTGVRSVTAQREALALVDTGSDEHICPASFASWMPAERLTKAPRLRDAQGTEIKHESLARTVGLVLRATAGEQVKVKVTLLIGPVRQPILSLGKLNSTFEVYMKGGDGGKLYFPLNKIEVEVAKVQNSYYVPFVLSRPEDEISQVRAIRMLHVEGNHVCFRKRMGADPDSASRGPDYMSVQEQTETRTSGRRRRRQVRRSGHQDTESRERPEKRSRGTRAKGESEPREERKSPEPRESSPLFSSSSSDDHRPRGRSTDDEFEEVRTEERGGQACKI